MATNYDSVIDSYAWIEYFRGTASGEKARQFIEKGSATTSAITLAELQEKYLREKWDSFDLDLKFMTTKTMVILLIAKFPSWVAGLTTKIRRKRRLGYGRFHHTSDRKNILC